MIRLFTLGLLLTLMTAGPSWAESFEFPFFQSVNPPRRVQVMAHRGAARQAPENTAIAIEHAIADGFEWVEIDVRLSKDGHHVVLHDGTLDRTTDGKGPVEAQTLATLKKLDAGSKYAKRFGGQQILSLKEAFALAKGRINLYLDCKRIDASQLVKDIIDAGMERQVVVFDSMESLTKIKAVPGGEKLPIMPKWHAEKEAEILAIQPAAIELNALDVTAARCNAFHDRGIKVQAKVLGDDDRPEVWDRVIADGVDWLQTDRAEEIIARETLRVIGLKPVKIACHRGAGRYAPENTLPSLEKAVILGADFVEFDVRTTRDGGLFLLHDSTLNRTTPLRGPIKEKMTAELVNLDAGKWFGSNFTGTIVPTQEAFFRAVGRRVELYVDAKDIAPEVLVEALRKHDLIDRSVVYGRVDFLEKLRNVEPRLRRMPPLGNPSEIDEIVRRVDPYAFDTRWTMLSKSLIDRCHSLKIKVFSDALGVNETIPRYQQAIRDGIDLIQTDHPLRVLRAMELLNVLNK